MSQMISLGLAEVDITPKGPVQLVGFNRGDNTSQGILDKLIGQVMIIKKQKSSYCIITIDSLGFTTEDTKVLRQKIANKLVSRTDHVMVCFSHTHSAPNNGVHRDYFNEVIDKLVKCVEQAQKSLIPIKAVWGTAQVDIGVNRRGDEASLDRRINLLKFVDARTEELIVLLLRVTAHANVLDRENHLISADFIGRTRQLLSERYGCNVMVTQGAGGNVSPRYKGSQDDLDQMAMEIYSSVAIIIDNLKPEEIRRLDMWSNEHIFESRVPSKEEAIQIAYDSMQSCGINGADWLKEVDFLINQGIKKQLSPVEIQYFTLNNGCLCGIPDEAMCELALEIAEKSEDQLIYFGGYTNGCSGYLATAQEHQLGGYEVLYAYLLYYKYHKRVMSFKWDTGDKLVQLVTKTWDDYRL